MKQEPPTEIRTPRMSDAARDIIAGGCAGMASISIMYPMDTIRTRLQMSGSQGKPQSVRSCIAGTVRNEGVRALYKGMAFPFTAQVAFKVVIFTTNGIARRVLDKRGLAESPAGIFACGALGGGVNSFLVTPVELVRTRLMLQFDRDTRSNPSSIKGPVDCIRRIVRRSGVRSMWQGLTVAFTRDSLGMGAFFLSFDTTKRVLMRRRHGDGAQSKRPADFDIMLLAGSTAGLSFWSVALPFDMTKTIIQAAEPKKGEPVPGAVATVTRLFREGGFRRFYMGWPVAFGRGIPGAAIMLATHTYVWRALEGQTLAPAIPAAGNVA